MENPALRADNTAVCDEVKQALERLALYEGLHADLKREQQSIAQQMAELGARGKQKTVKYRELFAHKLYNAHVLSLFQSRGL